MMGKNTLQQQRPCWQAPPPLPLGIGPVCPTVDMGGPQSPIPTREHPGTRVQGETGVCVRRVWLIPGSPLGLCAT